MTARDLVAEPFASVSHPGMAWAVYDWSNSPSTLVAGSERRTRAQAEAAAAELEGALFVMGRAR